ncbi:hypothetical protein LQ327_14835 [Actinomycetospora endophytica]|uniref:Membrane protein YphA (DoxX/SURF4 family) n=1 Tax=Actinomycetospora endophytica TaxID=2291215 RepID=A0ABS8P9P0_9PSEU|nr:hypothetical protein [Actinomycetospora endophytica]MCD2194647.1 hypothetical protein [Actinomycetospora endophytica]
MSTIPVTTGLGTADPEPHRSRGPVQRADGARSLRLVAVSFGVTVVLTRLYLALTGYPQIGGGQYHLAHALWGGLLLLIGGLLALLWANHWVQHVTAVCVGVGSGLFVDEVGKFITAANDYFTPLAAPIIYVVFLAVLGLATLARRTHLDGPRARAYAAADGLKEVADGPLTPAARTALLADLTAMAADPSRPDLAAHAAATRPLVEAAPVEPPGHRTRTLRAAVLRAENVLFPRWVHRLALIAGSALLGLFSLVGLVVLIVLWAGGPETTLILDDQVVPHGSRPPLLVVASAGEAIVGVLLFLAAVALVLGRDRWGTTTARAGLVIALAGVNVALGYLDAELVVSAVVVEFALLLLVERYRARFVTG